MSEHSENKPLCSITGTVVHGPGIERFTGIPTADLALDEGSPLPETGVYVSRILLNGQLHYGVTHIGPQPTLNNTQMPTIETLILDFCGEIYGCRMQIELFRRLRAPEKYGNIFLLYSSPDTSFTKEEIYEAVWREPANGFCHAVENTVFQIRKKLRPLCGGRDCIRTLAGYGYRFRPI